MEEVFKDIKGYEGLYVISNLGTVMSIRFREIKRNKILSIRLSNSGYLCATLTKERKSRELFVHRLIADAFIPNEKKREQVNHINGIKTDNRISNLEWLSRSENQKHSYANGFNRVSDLQKQKTSEAKSSLVIDISNGTIYKSIRDACKQVSIAYSTLCTMLRGDMKNKTTLRFLNRRFEHQAKQK